MNDREEQIIDAALRVIIRYGVKRTTMNDIASEAGVARQTLYNLYANKEEILRATIRLFAERTLAAIAAESTETEDLGRLLDTVFEHLAVRPFELLCDSPDANDILRGFNDAAKEELSNTMELFRVEIEVCFTPYRKQLRTVGLTPQQLSDFVQRSLGAFKHDAKDKEHLLELLYSLKILILNIVSGKPG